ncbi:MAG: PTS sugar transporter subunit IIB [candidate division WOR-3 bacterium]|nr:PTS sugar transporter subunit IIB [candidate division WOR-3 bacterium]
MRIDDRLIHGQVTAGWVRPLGIQRIVLANDKVALDPLQREIYSLAVPPGIEVQILTVNEAISYLKNSSSTKKTIVIVDSPRDALKLVEGGIKTNTINVGGLHYEQGKHPLTSYIFLSDNDFRDISLLIEKGIILEGQEIPGSPKVVLNSLILTKFKQNTK